MAEQWQDTCLNCQATIPEGTADCPSCGMELVFCFNESCERSYPSQLLYCPHCETPNELIGRPSEVTSPAASKPEVSCPPQSLKNAPFEPPQPAVKLPLTSPPQGPSDEQPLCSVSAPGTPLASVGKGLYAQETLSPIVLEMHTGQSPRRGQQCLLLLRAFASGLSEETLVEVYAESEWWSAPELMSVRLHPGEVEEFPARGFTPQQAGQYQMRIVVTLKNSGGLPIGRWKANQVLLVEDIQREVPTSVHAEEGSVVIMSGSAPLMPGFPLAAGIPALLPPWQRLALQPFQVYFRRLARTCPESTDDFHLQATSAWPAFEAACGTIGWTDLKIGQLELITVVCGVSAGLGCDNEVARPARIAFGCPDNYRSKHYTHHLLVELRNGRAWVTDRGMEPIWLNQETLPKGMPEILAEGDHLDVSRDVSLFVRLVAQRGRVHAIWFEAQHESSPRLSYLLTDCAAAVRVSPIELEAGQPRIALLRGNGLVPHLGIRAPGESGDWSDLAPNEERTFGQYRVVWHSSPKLLSQPGNPNAIRIRSRRPGSH